MSALDGPRLRDPEAEAAYRQRFLAEDARLAVTIISLMAAATVLSGFNDARFLESTGLWWMWAARIAGGLGAAMLSVLCLRTRRPAVLDGLVLLWVCAGAVFAFGVHATRPQDYLLPIVIEAAFTMMIWSLVPNRFVFQALAAGVVAAETIGWLTLFRRPLSPEERVLIGVTLAAANLIGAVASWRGHRLRRSLFIEHRKLVASEAEVTVLSRLLPICMYCKKIRGEAGQWDPVEQYISERTRSRVSHGMCDDCDAVHGHHD
jgi:hypothetical protein